MNNWRDFLCTHANGRCPLFAVGDPMADQGFAFADRQVPHAAPVKAVLVVDEMHRSAQGRRVRHQTPDEPQAPYVRALSEEEAKMRESRSHPARLEQFARSGEGDRILGIAEHARIQPDAGRKVGGIDAELSRSTGVSAGPRPRPSVFPHDLGVPRASSAGAFGRSRLPSLTPMPQFRLKSTGHQNAV